MKKSRIFMAAGAFVLAVSAIFATKANKRFNLFSTAYANSGNITWKAAEGNIFTVTSNSSLAKAYAALCTVNGFRLTYFELVTAVHSDPVYFKP